MADDWDVSDEEPTTNTTANTATITSAAKTTNNHDNSNKNKSQQKKKRKRKKKRKKNKGKDQLQQSTPSTSKPSTSTNTTNTTTTTSTTPSPAKKTKKTKKKPQHDTWSDTDTDEEEDDNKKQTQIKAPPLLLKDANASTIANKQKTKTKTNKKTKTFANLDEESNGEDDDDQSTQIDKKSRGLYPIWRPEQHYKYKPTNYDYQPNFIQRDEILLKVKRKETFEQVIAAFEEKHGIAHSFDAGQSSRELLEVYGCNIYNKLVPIYENIGDDNHRPFMIDFDSLLLDIFHSPLISTQLKYGPRLLPILHVLDNYLDLLFGGGRSAQIIIFECNESVWKYQIHFALRQYIKYYLFFYWQPKQQHKYSINYPLVLQYESFWHISFSDYIYQYLPVFALIVRPDYSPFIFDENRYLFIYQTFYLIALQIPCVQSTEISFSSNALYGFTVHVPSNIDNYILNKFRSKKQSSSSAIQLKPLLPPLFHNHPHTPPFNKDVFTNLNFLDTIANDKKNKDKRNISRLSTVYALISMFRDCKMTPFEWDFIRLLLLQLVVTENQTGVKDKCISEILPKIDINDTFSSKKASPSKQYTSWLDYCDDLSSEDEDVEDKEDKEDEKKQQGKRPQDEKKEKEKEKEYDLDKIIRDCWWYKITDLTDHLNQFMMHCTVFLSQYTNEYDNTTNSNVSNGHFDCKAFYDSFDFRIFCYLLCANNVLSGGDNKKTKDGDNKPRKWLNNEKKIMTNLGLTKENLQEFSTLYNLITAEINKKAKLYPVIQSEYLLSVAFKKQSNDYNKNIAQTKTVKSGYVRIEGDIINILMTDLEQELDAKGLLYSTKKVTGLKERSAFFRKYEWIKGGKIPDGIKPYVYEHRNYMIFQTFIAKYAQSLEGGKVVLRDVIVSKKKEEKKSEKKEVKSSYHKSKYSHKQKQKDGRAKINVRVAAEKEVQQKEREKKLEKVANLIKVCSTMYKDLESRIQRLDEELEETNDPIAALPGLTKLHQWATESALKCHPERNIYPIVRLWQITFDIFRRFIENQNQQSELPSLELIHSLQKSLHCMGFQQPARRIATVYVDKKCGALSLDEVLIPFTTDSIRISIGCSYARFQMEHCGPYMIRGVGSRPDPRVSGFYPDEWQVKLLDIVDHRYSALVVAPTSSGKTFVSYYCMKEILQLNKSVKSQREKGIVVYVSPTKALTWQACADIYSKYGDVFGVLTPDYDHKPLECQVLVCVPESFEKLLMSSQRTQLHKQIKYVIFDEIHCLGRSEGGAIWERLLMLIRAPFLALSATVGHPLKLKKWLNTISNVLQLRSDEYKHKVRIIQHKERWSYLEKRIYLPDNRQRINDKAADIYIGCNKETIGWKSSILGIHPVGAIGLTTNNNVLDVYDGFPPLTFSPSDCVTLYDSMTKYVDQIGNIKYKQRLMKLKPDLFFREMIYITKNQASKYEKLLKKELKSWIVGFNKKSQIIDQDLFDIKDDDPIDMDEKLVHVDIDETAQAKNSSSTKANGTKLSKKERKKLQQQKRKADLAKQRLLAEQRREQQRMAKKRKKVKKKEKITKQAVVEEKKEEKKQDHRGEIEEEILSLTEKHKRRVIVDKLLNSMAANTLERIDRMEKVFANRDCYSFEWVLTNFINLVIELDSTDRLPALCFVLDRVQCEQLYLKLLSDLEYLEEKKKQQEMGAVGNSKEMEIERRRRQKKLEKQKKKEAKLREQKNRQKKNEEENPEIHDGLDDDLSLMGESRDYRFTLFERGDEMDSDEMRFWTKRLLKKTKWPLTHPLMKGLERGIGLHHEGLPLQYRHLVETLFRARHIKLVVSVASLAMGVNMPARSVVFAGDSHMLDPLNYRQMMGRAGRRGYDNVGNVIFCGISPRKISYLMTSQLTSLNGHYPILSTTSSIRCTQLLCKSIADEDCDEKYYIGLVKNLFHKPFNYKIPGYGDDRQLNIVNKFRYSLEYHLQNGLLSIDNLEVDCLGSLASVLHEYEPNNFLFIKLLQSGYLHKVCSGYTKIIGDHNSKLKKDILCKLILIFCYIFELHPIPSSYVPKANKSSYLSKSHLRLPIDDLDEELLQMIDKYRYDFISHYYNMYYLPQKNNNNDVGNIFGDENVINYIEYYLKYFDGGIFGNNQIFLSDFRGRAMHCNAYIYDFYMHEDYKRIVDEACLRDGLAWRKLKKFQLLLSIINKSLNDISCLKSKQDLINEDVKLKIEEFEGSLQKLRQHKFSIYRRQQQFWMDTNGKLWKKYEIEQKKDNLRLQAIGDDFVMAFQDLNKDFRHKFRHIVPIGPIANYDSFINPAITTTDTTTTTTTTTTTKKKKDQSLSQTAATTTKQ